MQKELERTRNPVVARYRMLKAFALRQRPIDLERRLRSDATATFGREPVTPAVAWKVYTRQVRVPCFADCGWLVQYGVYGWNGAPETFQFSLVRQTLGLEHWNDEFYQVELRLHHPPTPELRALKPWDDWSFEYSSPDAFFKACAARPGVARLLSDNGSGWTWEVDLNET